MYFLPYSAAAEEVGDQCFRHCQSLLVGNAVGSQPLGKTVHNNQEVFVSLVALWEGP
jgi:hypothetical protein